MSRNTSNSWLFNSCYVALSAVGLYYMRLGPDSQLTGKVLEPLMKGATGFTYPGRPDITIRKQYTGVPKIDGLLSVLVTAFLAGSAGMEQRIQLQQINFLFAFAPVLLVFSVEAMRLRRWSLIYFTSVWAFFYQTVGGAIIIPLYPIAHNYAFSKPNSVRAVPTSSAKAILPAFILGYVLPTAAMFYPFANIDHTMIATAIWQPSPIALNLIWVALGFIMTNTGSPHKYLKRALAVSGLIAAAAHFATLGVCLSSSSGITLQSVFLPIPGAAVRFSDAVHFVFQIDYLLICAAMTLWCVQRKVQTTSANKGLIGAVLTILSVLCVGPGATMSVQWYRELGSSKA